MPPCATRDAAYASVDDNDKGSISAGKYADFVVLFRDILTAPSQHLLEARVLLTVMRGRETYRAP